MNITFFIGNGFDIGLGLKTKYTDFYHEYCSDTANDDENIASFKSLLKEWQRLNQETQDEKLKRKIEDWADFEKAFGEHSSDDAIKDGVSYAARFEDFVTKFNLYLENEEKNVDYSDADSIAKVMKSGVTSYHHIRRADRLRIEQRYNQIGGQRTYNFITFNYTRTIDRCANILKNSIKSETGRTVGNIVHIHGYVDENMIMGVNDISQITNEKFANDPTVSGEIVKPTQNAECRTNYESEAIPIINGSNIICIYGMSLGDTDKKWWQHIFRWLSGDNGRYLVILTHSDKYNKKLPFTQTKVTNEIVGRFLSFSNSSDEIKNRVANQIFVGVNYDVFAMKLRKPDVVKSEETKEEKIANAVALAAKHSDEIATATKLAEKARELVTK